MVFYRTLWVVDMTEKKVTTIQVYEETRKQLAELKIHPREPYDDVIRRLLKKWKEQNSHSTQ